MPYVGVTIGVSVKSIAIKAAEVVGVEVGIGLAVARIAVDVLVFAILGDVMGGACIGGEFWQALMNKTKTTKMKTLPFFHIMKNSFHKPLQNFMPHNSLELRRRGLHHHLPP